MVMIYDMIWYVSFRGHGGHREDGKLITRQRWFLVASRVVFPCVFRATVLTHWTSAKPSVPKGAATVCYCGTVKCQCCHQLEIWMNIESARFIDELVACWNRTETQKMVWKNACGVFRRPPWKELSCKAQHRPSKNMVFVYSKTWCLWITWFLCKTALCVKDGFDAKTLVLFKPRF